MYNFDDIEITAEDRQILEENLESVTLSYNVTVNGNKFFVSRSMNIDPELGSDKAYKFLRQKLKYDIQQGIKDLEREYWSK